jgi:hypothetical protein
MRPLEDDDGVGQAVVCRVTRPPAEAHGRRLLVPVLDAADERRRLDLDRRATGAAEGRSVQRVRRTGARVALQTLERLAAADGVDVDGTFAPGVKSLSGTNEAKWVLPSASKVRVTACDGAVHRHREVEAAHARRSPSR